MDDRAPTACIAPTLATLPMVCLGYHPWSDMWKRNQSMTAELARQRLVERLLFLNPEVSLVTSPARLRYELATVRRFSWTGIWPRRPAARTCVMTPVHCVPFRHRSPRLGAWDRGLIRGAVRRTLRTRGPYVLLVNTARPESQELVDLLWDDAVLRVFDWSDDFAEFQLDPRGREAIEHTTTRLLERADLVLAVNEVLAERVRRVHHRVHTLINATNMRPLTADHELPPAVRALRERWPGPILGYAGYINEHRVDVELVDAIARRHPEWSLCFIGPVFRGFERRFPALPNLHFHPAVPHAELQDYLALFDVCLIPHLRNAHTAGNNPLKLYDYLTTGRPVVATRIAGMQGFEDVVTVVETREAFVAAIERAVAGDEPPGAAARRQERAAAHHWSVRAREAAAALER
ncbi:MAG: glycosyltransferase, partial [Candidatus Eiseniibacteriota bacterium]